LGDKGEVNQRRMIAEIYGFQTPIDEIDAVV